MTDAEQIERPLQALVAAFNDHDLDRIMSYFANDWVLEMPRGPHRYGGGASKQAGDAGRPNPRFKGLPDVHYAEDRHYVCGNTGISKWHLTGTTPDGRRVDVNGCDFYEFRNGRIVRKDSYWKIVDAQ